MYFTYKYNKATATSVIKRFLNNISSVFTAKNALKKIFNRNIKVSYVCAQHLSYHNILTQPTRLGKGLPHNLPTHHLANP